METEVKLSFKDKDLLYGMASADFFRELCTDTSEPETVLLENTYIDTPDMNITKRSGAIRVRHYKGNSVDKYEFTVKYGGSVTEGLHKRLEWNVRSDDGNFRIADFKAKAITQNAEGDSSEALDELFEGITDDGLSVICSNSFSRAVYHLAYQGTAVEACFDSGIICNSDGSKTDEICELELELIEGDMFGLAYITGFITDENECAPLEKTKYSRTLNMAMGYGNEE